MNHKEWLDNEYNLWIEALQRATVDNFHDTPQVKRMLGEVDPDIFLTQEVIKEVNRNELLLIIDNIGRKEPLTTLSGTCLRMAYYGLQVIKHEPLSIVEIGGGVGQFYAVLRALGYNGEYYIWDLTEVKKFQYKYLQKVNELTDLNTDLGQPTNNFCVSFYALGEFDDEAKDYYLQNVVNKCKHGFIIWNGHSGASNNLSKIRHNLEIKAEDPVTLNGNLQIKW